MRHMRNIRKSKSFSQNALAKAAGISQSLLSDIENEKVSPTINVVKKIADALDMPLVKLLEEKETA